MNTLIVNSHPDFSNPYSFTTILQEKFIELYNEHFPNHQLSILNLYDCVLPELRKKYYFRFGLNKERVWN